MSSWALGNTDQHFSVYRIFNRKLKATVTVTSWRQLLESYPHDVKNKFRQVTFCCSKWSSNSVENKTKTKEKSEVGQNFICFTTLFIIQQRSTILFNWQQSTHNPKNVTPLCVLLFSDKASNRRTFPWAQKAFTETQKLERSKRRCLLCCLSPDTLYITCLHQWIERLFIPPLCINNVKSCSPGSWNTHTEKKKRCEREQTNN